MTNPSTPPRSAPWVLVLESALNAELCVAGLPLATRLAFAARNSGAAAVVSADPQITALLHACTRLALPIERTIPDGAVALRIGANYVLHADHFRAALAELGAKPPPPNAQPQRREPTQHGAQPLLELLGAFVPGPYNFTPLAVTDRTSARRAERALFRSLRKPQDGWTSRYLNRYLSLAISRWLVRTPLTPNTVSVGILGVGLLGAWFASRGDGASLLLGAALFQAQSVLDGCDGEMSRVTYRGSLRGQWLDTVGDDVTNYGFFAGAGWGLFKTTGQWTYLAAAIVTVVCGGLASGIEYRYLIKIGSGDLLRYPLSAGASSSGWTSALQPLFKRDTFVFLTLLAALAGQVGPMLFAFALGAVLILVSVIRTEIDMARATGGASVTSGG